MHARAVSTVKCWIHLRAPIGLIECQGALRLDTVARVRDAVWTVARERPEAIVLDLAGMGDVEELSANVVPALGRAVAKETDAELIVAAPSAAVRRAAGGAGAALLRCFDTLSEAMEAASSPTPRRWVTRELPAELDAGHNARRVVGEACRRWQLLGLRESAQLIVGELVTNAVEHGGAPVELCVTVRRRVLRIEVSDYGPPTTGGHAASDDSADGTAERGLRLVEALANNWGAVPTPQGRTVWADLAISAPARRGPC